MTKHVLAALVLASTLLLGHAARGGEADDGEEAPADAPVAGWVEDEGFVLKSADDAFKLRLGLVGAFKFEPLLVEGEWQDRRAFSLLRPYFGGNLFQPWIRYFVDVELAASPPFLLDAYVAFVPWEELGVQAGQFATPFSRHEWFAANQILFPDWSVTANYFWSGFDKGVALFGQFADHRLAWWAALTGGSPIRQFTTLSGNYVVQGRVTYSPVGPLPANEFPYLVLPDEPAAPFGLSFTLNAWLGNVQLVAGNFNPGTFSVVEVPTGETERTVVVGADVFLQAPWLSLFGEAYWRRLNPEEGAEFDSWGAWGEAGVLLVPSTFDAGIRVNYVDPATTLDEDVFRSVEAQVGWYIWRNNLVLRARYGVGEQQSPGEAALGAVTLPVAAVGTIHIFTLQGTIAF